MATKSINQMDWNVANIADTEEPLKEFLKILQILKDAHGTTIESVQVKPHAVYLRKPTVFITVTASPGVGSDTVDATVQKIGGDIYFGPPEDFVQQVNPARLAGALI